MLTRDKKKRKYTNTVKQAPVKITQNTQKIRIKLSAETQPGLDAFLPHPATGSDQRTELYRSFMVLYKLDLV